MSEGKGCSVDELWLRARKAGKTARFWERVQMASISKQKTIVLCPNYDHARKYKAEAEKRGIDMDVITFVNASEINAPRGRSIDVLEHEN